MGNNLILDWDEILSLFDDVSVDDWKKAAETEIKLHVAHNRFYDYSIEPLDLKYAKQTSNFNFGTPKLSCRFDLRKPHAYQYMQEAAKSEIHIARVESNILETPLTEELISSLYAIFPDSNKTRILFYSYNQELDGNKHNVYLGYDISSINVKIAAMNFYARNFSPASRLFHYALYMRTMEEDGLKFVSWHLPSDMNFVFTVAYFRAARKFWQHLYKDLPCRIGGYTTRYVESDLHQNLIRATTQTAAMIIGGCDEIEISPVSQSVEGYRWSFNIYNLLMYESNLSVVSDAIRGSSIVERLSDSIFSDAMALTRRLDLWTNIG